MNTTEMKGTWEEQKGKLKQRFAVLTDNDLMFAEGKKEEMYGRLQKSLGKTKAELQCHYLSFLIMQVILIHAVCAE